MSRSNILDVPPIEPPLVRFQEGGRGLDYLTCEQSGPHKPSFITTHRIKARAVQIHSFSDDWMKDVPTLIARLSSMVLEKKLQELRVVVNDFERRIHRLESVQTKVVPINTFAPEKYELLKPILVSVFFVEGGFEAGWFDANIHTSGDNEEEAVSNLKSLILDFFDSFSKEPLEKLGVEPKRQLSVINAFIKRTA
jgi:hypothetical protein